MNDFKKPLYPNLEATLASVGWSYTDLGKYLGLSPVTVSDRMRGVSEFKLPEVVKITQLFNKPFEWLFIKGQCE